MSIRTRTRLVQVSPFATHRGYPGRVLGGLCPALPWGNNAGRPAASAQFARPDPGVVTGSAFPPTTRSGCGSPRRVWHDSAARWLSSVRQARIADRSTQTCVEHVGFLAARRWGPRWPGPFRLSRTAVPTVAWCATVRLRASAVERLRCKFGHGTGTVGDVDRRRVGTRGRSRRRGHHP